MISKAPFGATKAVIGCSVLFLLLAGVLGIVISFFIDDAGLASMIRKRCILGIAIGIVIILLWKIVLEDID